MPEPTLQELRDKLHQANDDYHEVINEMLCCGQINVKYKVIIGFRARVIFDLMNELNSFMDNL